MGASGVGSGASPHQWSRRLDRQPPPDGTRSEASTPTARRLCFLGRCTFGYHAMEFDTALRYDLPIIAIVGTTPVGMQNTSCRFKVSGKSERLVANYCCHGTTK